MSTDRISPSSSMLELVRTLTGERGQRAGRSTPGRVGTRASSSTRRGSGLKVLRARLSDLVGPIDPDDEAAVTRIRRPLLQEIVLWEFGSDFRQDPEFAPMLDTIERAFDADSRMPGRLAGLIRDLRR